MLFAKILLLLAVVSFTTPALSQSKPDDKFAAIEVIVEKNWPVISNALKFNPTAGISMESVKQAVTEQMQNIFPEAPWLKWTTFSFGQISHYVATV